MSFLHSSSVCVVLCCTCGCVCGTLQRRAALRPPPQILHGRHEAAAAVFSKACTAGNATACFNLGALHSTARLEKASQSAATRLFAESCMRGSARGCYWTGLATLQSLGVVRDPPKAISTCSLFLCCCFTCCKA